MINKPLKTHGLDQLFVVGAIFLSDDVIFSLQNMIDPSP